MKCLSVLLKPTKWNKFYFACIIDKVRKIITSWGTTHLSFLGRAQLVSSVLFGIHAYWVECVLSPSVSN